MAQDMNEVRAGGRLPNFRLTSVFGEEVTTRELPTDTPVLVMSLCNHCPYVVHIEDELAAMCREYADEVVSLAISANDDDSYPDDGPDQMREQAERAGFEFPYLFDEDQSVVKRFHMSGTPDFFLYDRDHRLAYHGRFDDSRSTGEVTGADLRVAIESVVADDIVPTPWAPSFGCTIKWRPGNEPDYIYQSHRLLDVSPFRY